MSLSAQAIAVLAALLPSLCATTITVLPALNMAQAREERNSWLEVNFGAGTTAQTIPPDIQHSRGKLELLTSFYNLFFFITDVEGTVQIRTADGTTARVRRNDAGLYFVGITSSEAIGSIQWRGNRDFELHGLGIPNNPNPEPSAWLTVAGGLGLVLLLRRFHFRRPCTIPSAPSPNAPSIGRSARPARLLRAERRQHNRARP